MRRNVFKLVPLVAVALIYSALPSSTSSAATSLYPRVTRNFIAVPLKTRGFLNNDCLAQLMYPCLSNAGEYRPEATAQARVLQELTGLVPYISAPVSMATDTDSLQWEVAPTNPPCPDTGDPADTRIDDTSITKPTTGPCWRVDVVRDYGNRLGLFEIKRWLGPATRTNVDDQIKSYAARMPLYKPQLNAERDPTLDQYPGPTILGWRLAYPDDVGNVSCAWANAVYLDGNIPSPGNVYFAPLEETPPAVRDLTPGCDSATQDKSRQKYKEAKETSETIGLSKPVAATAAITAVVALFMATRPPPSVPPGTKPLPPVVVPNPDPVRC